MATPFLSEIRLMSFGYAPQGWALCNGQLLPINQNQALFSLLGTTYGGNGQTTFGLPNLQGRVPVHVGTNPMGASYGEENHTLILTEMPSHTHALYASSASANSAPSANTLLAAAANVYGAPASNLTSILPSSISMMGGNQSHVNMQPFTVLNYCIALQGIFPSRN